MILNNKVAIITGGTGALGRSVIGRFIYNGAFVTSTYIVKREQYECLKLIDDNTKCNFIKADVTNEKEVKNLVGVTLKNNNRIDFLINIVGGFTDGAIVDTDEKIFDKMINMNLRSTFLCCKNVIPHMIKNKYGRIINIAARPALKGMAGTSVYGASKAGVLNLTQSIAEEVKQFNINVNAIIPGTIDTPANRKAMPKAKFSNWVKPESIADVITFLCSEGAKDINGAAIPVYGKS